MYILLIQSFVIDIIIINNIITVLAVLIYQTSNL